MPWDRTLHYRRGISDNLLDETFDKIACLLGLPIGVGETFPSLKLTKYLLSEWMCAEHGVTSAEGLLYEDIADFAMFFQNMAFEQADVQLDRADTKKE